MKETDIKEYCRLSPMKNSIKNNFIVIEHTHTHTYTDLFPYKFMKNEKEDFRKT